MATMEPLDTTWNAALWQQFGAALEMYDNALKACPDALWRAHLWSDPSDQSQPYVGEFWRTAYHTLYWLDLYLSSIAETTSSATSVAPPLPFQAPDLDAEDDPPERPYTREELRAYLAYTTQKCQRTIASLQGKRAFYPYEFPLEKGQGRPVSYVELMLYAMRHTQEHAAQLSLFLGQHGTPDADLDWVLRANVEG